MKGFGLFITIFTIFCFGGTGFASKSGFSEVKASRARVLVIVNVEDTLKVTHSQSFWDSLNYLHDSESQFLGMKDVLDLLLANQSTALVYLTAPQELLEGQIQVEFLKKNDFPRGYLVGYQDNDDVQARLELLRNSMEVIKPTKVILLGHNGGMDVEVFYSLAEEYNQVKFYQYIHILYSPNYETEAGKVLMGSQFGYVTAAEVITDMVDSGLVNEASGQRFVRALLPKILNEDYPGQTREWAIPFFVKCDIFVWPFELSQRTDHLVPLKDYLSKRCYSSNSFYEN